MKTVLLLLVTLTLSKFSKAQSLAINTDSSTANSSAIVDVKSTTKGMLIPRMDSLQRATIPIPVTGLLVFQTNKDSGFYFYDGAAWQQFITGDNNLWKKNGTHIHNSKAYTFLLINAVKEQNKKMETQQKQLDAQQKQIDEQRKMIEQLLKK